MPRSDLVARTVYHVQRRSGFLICDVHDKYSTPCASTIHTRATPNGILSCHSLLVFSSLCLQRRVPRTLLARSARSSPLPSPTPRPRPRISLLHCPLCVFMATKPSLPYASASRIGAARTALRTAARTTVRTAAVISDHSRVRPWIRSRASSSRSHTVGIDGVLTVKVFCIVLSLGSIYIIVLLTIVSTCAGVIAAVICWELTLTLIDGPRR